MRYAVTAMLAAVLVFAVCTAQAGETGETKTLKELVQEIQEPITISGVLSDKMNVLFEHSTHKGIACLNCHHARKEDERFVACHTCHKDTLFTVMHSNRMGERSCYGCHIMLARRDPDSYAARFNGCQPCHTNITLTGPAPAADGARR